METLSGNQIRTFQLEKYGMQRILLGGRGRLQGDYWFRPRFVLFCPRLSVVFAIISVLHGFLCRKGLNSLAFRSEMTGFEMIPDMLVVNDFPAVFVTLGPAIFSFVVVGFQLCTSLQLSRESCSLKIKLFNS